MKYCSECADKCDFAKPVNGPEEQGKCDYCGYSGKIYGSKDLGKKHETAFRHPVQITGK